jgi:hypothetical protein
MDDMGRSILGLPAHMKAAAASIVPGTYILVQRHGPSLVCIFENFRNNETTAFSKNPKAASSPFQYRFEYVSLEPSARGYGPIAE